MKFITWLAYFISALGAINWGLVKFFRFNAVEWIAQMIRVNGLADIAYAVIALSGLYAFISLFMVQ